MASLPTISPEDYLLRDRANAYKSEYCLGHMYAMAGASDRHNVINSNINGALFSRLREKGCRAPSSDQRIYANQTPFFAYPDTVVTCGEKQFLPDQNKDTLVNPLLIFEVLSESTREYDLGLKFAMYKPFHLSGSSSRWNKAPFMFTTGTWSQANESNETQRTNSFFRQ